MNLVMMTRDDMRVMGIAFGELYGHTEDDIERGAAHVASEALKRLSALGDFKSPPAVGYYFGRRNGLFLPDEAEEAIREAQALGDVDALKRLVPLFPAEAAEVLSGGSE